MSANLTLENNYFKSYSLPQAKNYCVAVSLTDENFITHGGALSIFIPMQPVNNTTQSLSDSWTVAPPDNPSRIVCNVSGWYRISSLCNIVQETSQAANLVKITTDLYLNGNAILPLNKECFPSLTVSPDTSGDFFKQIRNSSFNIILFLNEGDYVEARVAVGAGLATGYTYRFRDLNVYCDYLGF